MKTEYSFVRIPVGLEMLPLMLTGISHFRRCYMDKNLEKLLHIIPKGYAHFDSHISMRDALTYCQCKKLIAKHAFYPFIFFNKRYDKY